MTSKFFRALLLLLASLFLASPLLAEPIRNSITGVTYPDAIGEFERGKYTDFEKDYPGQGLGYSFNYLTPHDPQDPKRITATVYAYKSDFKVIPSTIDSPAGYQLRDKTLDEIERYAQKSESTLTPLVSNAKMRIKTSHGTVIALMDGFNADTKTGATNTWVWLWTAKGHFMKIRITGRGHVNGLPERSRSFVEQMIRLTVE